MAELVDALELKIEFRKECWFDSGQGHHASPSRATRGAAYCGTDSAVFTFRPKISRGTRTMNLLSFRHDERAG